MNENYFTEEQVELMFDFRKLWEQHVFWTRLFIVSTVADLPDLQFTTQRLLRNPADFAKIFSEFYGKEKADTFEKLLTEHLLLAADLLNAAKVGNTAGVEQARISWYANADEISEFLSKINSYWSKTEWQKMFYSHLKMTEEEATLQLTGNYEESINTFDLIENEALVMADYMSYGFIKAFM